MKSKSFESSDNKSFEESTKELKEKLKKRLDRMLGSASLCKEDEEITRELKEIRQMLEDSEKEKGE